jgi:hypothetical protein
VGARKGKTPQGGGVGVIDSPLLQFCVNWDYVKMGKIKNNTQPYIYGREIHCESFGSNLYHIYMVGLGGYPIMRDLDWEAAEFIVDCVNSRVPDEFTALAL